MTQTKNLFDTINADAFYHLGKYKESYPALGDELYEVFRSTSFWGDLKATHLTDLYMALPKEIWDGHIMTLVWVFQSQMTTTKTPSL